VQVGAFFVRKPRPGGCHGVRFKRSVPFTVNDVLEGHVALDLECLDRLHLQGYLGQLQVSEQVIQFLTHRGIKIYAGSRSTRRRACSRSGMGSAAGWRRSLRPTTSRWCR
jgi:hypothetical protein